VDVDGEVVGQVGMSEKVVLRMMKPNDREAM